MWTAPHRAWPRLVVLAAEGYETETPTLYRQFGNQRSEKPPTDPLELDFDGTVRHASVPEVEVEQARAVVSRLKFAAAGDGRGVLGATLHHLRIEADYTLVELHWSHELPAAWSELGPLIDQLERLSKLVRN